MTESTINEHLSEEQLGQVVEAMQRDTVNQLPEEIQTHLNSCFSCKKEAMELFDLMESAKNDQREIKLTNPKKQTSARSKWVAAAAWVLLGGSIGYYFSHTFLLQNGPDTTVEVITTPSDTSSPVQEELSDVEVSDTVLNKPDSTTKVEQNVSEVLYAEYQPFEEQLELNLRSGGLNIKSPALGEEIPANGEYSIEWEQSEADSVEILIYDNLGQVLLFETISENRYSLNPTTLGGEGLYYWKLVINDDVRHLGKFSIANK